MDNRMDKLEASQDRIVEILSLILKDELPAVKTRLDQLELLTAPAPSSKCHKRKPKCWRDWKTVKDMQIKGMSPVEIRTATGLARTAVYNYQQMGADEVERLRIKASMDNASKEMYNRISSKTPDYQTDDPSEEEEADE